MNTGSVVARSVFILLLSQVATNLLSFVAVPLLPRALGTADYGRYWVAMTIAVLGAQLVDWGHEGFLPLAVARAQGRAQELLEGSLTLKLLIGLGLALPLEGLMRLLGYPPRMRLVAFLLYLACVLNVMVRSAMAVLRGLERMGWPGALRVGAEATYTAALVVAVWLGARLEIIAALPIFVTAAALALSARALAPLGTRPWRPRLSAARELLRDGAPFLVWGGVVALQSSVEAVLLSRFGSPEAVGWFGASTKLVGVLLFPASILSSALAPTLGRLHASDGPSFQRAVREGVRASLLLGVPVAAGTFLFADQGVALVFGAGFGPSAANLRILAAYIVLVFVDIVLASALLVCGRRITWALSKAAMLALSVGASVLLIRYWQARSGNGGLGAAAVTAGAELGMLAFALALLPRGLLGSGTLVDLLRALAAGAAMPAATFCLRDTPFGVQLIGALGAYAATLAAIGGIGARDVALLREALRARGKAR